MTAPYTGDVYRVAATLRRDGLRTIGKWHLVFSEGFPFAVLEWVDVAGGMAPSEVAKLDPRYVKELPPSAEGREFLYESEIRWPEDKL